MQGAPPGLHDVPRIAANLLTFWWQQFWIETMRRIAYARVSTTHQNLDRQIAALRTEKCDVIFREKASGKTVKGRPELEKANRQVHGVVHHATVARLA